MARVDPVTIIGLFLLLLATLYLILALRGSAPLLWGTAAFLYVLSLILFVYGSRSRPHAEGL